MGVDCSVGCCGGCSGETVGGAMTLPVTANTLPDGDYLDLIDRLAELAHEQWSDWMQYLFAQAQANPDGSVTIPADRVARWRRQSTTAFEDLPAAEQLSDAKEALRTAIAFYGWIRENKPTR